MIHDTTNSNLEYLNEVPVVDGLLNEQGVLNVALSFFNIVRGLYVKTLDTSIIEGKKYYIYEDGNYTEVLEPSSAYLNTYYEKSTEKEVILFNTYLPLAKLYCCRMFDWSFQTETKTYSEDDISNSEEVDDIDELESGNFVEKKSDGKYIAYKMYKDFRYAFKLPEGFIKAKYINGKQNVGFAVKRNLIYCNSKTPTIDYITKEITNIPDDFGYLIAYRVAVELAQHIDPDGNSGTRASQMFTLQGQALTQNESASFRLSNPRSNYYVDPDSEYWKQNGVVVR